MGIGSFLKKAAGAATSPLRTAGKATVGAAKMAHKSGGVVGDVARVAGMAKKKAVHKAVPRGNGHSIKSEDSNSKSLY